MALPPSTTHAGHPRSRGAPVATTTASSARCRLSISCSSSAMRDRALADSERLSASVRFRAVTGRPSRQLPRLGCAKGRHMHSSNLQLYSTTSSASEISLSVTASPSALAIFALIASSNFVGCATGRSAAFAPRRILSTYSAARRYISVKLAP